MEKSVYNKWHISFEGINVQDFQYFWEHFVVTDQKVRPDGPNKTYLKKNWFSKLLLKIEPRKTGHWICGKNLELKFGNFFKFVRIVDLVKELITKIEKSIVFIDSSFRFLELRQWN